MMITSFLYLTLRCFVAQFFQAQHSIVILVFPILWIQCSQVFEILGRLFALLLFLLFRVRALLFQILVAKIALMSNEIVLFEPFSNRLKLELNEIYIGNKKVNLKIPFSNFFS